MAEARHQNTNQQSGRVALAHTAYGGPASAYRTTLAASAPGTARAVGSFMRPYKGWAGRDPAKLCPVEGCKTYGSVTWDGLCLGHAKQAGKVDECEHEGCRRMPKRGEKLCFNHKPEVAEIEAALFDDDPG